MRSSDGKLVKPLSRNPEVVEAVEQRVREVPNFLGKTSLGEVAGRRDSLFFTIEDSGLIGAVDVKQGLFGVAHVTFWDGQLSDKVTVCREVAEFVMEAAGLKLLLTMVPRSRTHLIEFTREVGFVPVELNEEAGVLTLALMRGD